MNKLYVTGDDSQIIVYYIDSIGQWLEVPLNTYNYYNDSEGDIEIDAKLVCSHSNDDGTIAHAELDIFGQILAISESDQKETITGNSMQFCLHFGEGNEELVRRIIDNLSDGGEILYPGPVEWSPLLTDLIDKFGVHWCIFV